MLALSLASPLAESLLNRMPVLYRCEQSRTWIDGSLYFAEHICDFTPAVVNAVPVGPLLSPGADSPTGKKSGPRQ